MAKTAPGGGTDNPGPSTGPVIVPARAEDLDAAVSFAARTSRGATSDDIRSSLGALFGASDSVVLLARPAAAAMPAGHGDGDIAGLLAAGALAWDSAELGVAIARVRYLHSGGEAAPGRSDMPETIAAALLLGAGERGAAMGWRALWLRVPAGDLAAARGAEQAGAEYMGTLVTFARALASGDDEREPPGGMMLRSAASADIPALRRIAAVAFRGGRYHHDRLVDPDRVDAMWADSVENAVRGRASAVLVASEAGEPRGFITLHRDTTFNGDPLHETGVIGLIAVAPGQGGRGAGHLLVSGALRVFREAGVRSVQVGTQADNRAALSLYAGSGFRPEAVCLDYRLALGPRGGAGG